MEFNIIQDGVSRRGFLRGCAACAASLACPAAGIPGGKAKVRVVFTQAPKDKEGWPYVNYDYETRKKDMLARLRAGLPGIEFLPVTVMKPEESKELLNSGTDIDGYVAFLLGIPSSRASREIIAAGRPTVLVDDLYGGTGEFLGVYAWARRNNHKVAGVSSTKFDDVIQAVKCFDTMKKLRGSVILDVCERKGRPDGKAIEEAFGTVVRTATAEEINEAYNKAGKAEAQQFASTWIKNAKKVAEPSREEIGRSGLMYIAMRDMMKAHKAQAIDVDCLQLFYGKKLPAYPCLGFSQLNDDGLVGACEADLQSTISMLAFSYLTGRPGFISDPVIDTSKNQIIYAHCVAPTKVYGPGGKRNPYIIRDHSEDRKGAVLQSLLPVGEMTTTLRINPGRKQVVFHQAKAVANIDEDRACRTKLAAEVKDINKLLGEWDQWGWHRVTFYGDLRAAVEAFAALNGFSMVIEG